MKSSREWSILNNTVLYFIPFTNIDSDELGHESDCSGSKYSGPNFSTRFTDTDTVPEVIYLKKFFSTHVVDFVLSIESGDLQVR